MLGDSFSLKRTIIISTTGTCISCLLFGLSPNFYVALFFRSLGGLFLFVYSLLGMLNGNLATIKGYMGLIVIFFLQNNNWFFRRIQQIRPRAGHCWVFRGHLVQYLVRNQIVTFLIFQGPTIAGLSARLNKTYPHIFGGIWFFETFPYLLPTLSCAILFVISIVFAIVALEEPKKKIKQQDAMQQEYYSKLSKWQMLRAFFADYFGMILKREMLLVLLNYWICCQIFYTLEYAFYVF